jgi:hypothetical protein
MKHLLILLISIIILSSFLVSCEKKIGQGIITSADGDKYVGERKNGKENGHGTLIWSNGRKYVGEYKDGLPNGQGTYNLPSGQKYVGEWKDGQMWNGTKYNEDGNIVWKRVKGKMIK